MAIEKNAKQSTEGQPTELALQVIKKLKELNCNKAVLAIHIGCSRAMVSRYLAGKYESDPTTVETALRGWLEEIKDGGTPSEDEEPAPLIQHTEEPKTVHTIPAKVPVFQSEDYLHTISVCQSCQEDMGLGIIVGRTGYGKTHALKNYAKLPRVAYIECDDTMSCRDLVDALELALGMVKASGGTIWKRVNRMREFLNVNEGYLIIVDEADKLMNKYTAAKMEIIRSIFDQADVGIVIAGEPKLEASIKTGLARFANRVDFYYKLHGLTTKELSAYLEGWDVTEDAATVLAERACGARNGCFRLLDRTLNNVRRVLADKGDTKVTVEVVREASGMMMM